MQERDGEVGGVRTEYIIVLYWAMTSECTLSAPVSTVFHSDGM